MEAREEPAGPSGRSLASEGWQADYFKAIPELEQLARYVQTVQHWSNIHDMPEACTCFQHTSTLPSQRAFCRRVKKPLNLVILRSSQLDAGRLDSELTGMLQEQFMKAFSLVQPVRISRRLLRAHCCTAHVDTI